MGSSIDACENPHWTAKPPIECAVAGTAPSDRTTRTTSVHADIKMHRMRVGADMSKSRSAFVATLLTPRRYSVCQSQPSRIHRDVPSADEGDERDRDRRAAIA